MTPKTKTFLERGFSTIVLLGILGGALAWDSPIGYGILICLLCNLTTVEWVNMLKNTGTNRALLLVAGLLYPWGAFALQMQEFHIDILVGQYPLACLVLYSIAAFIIELLRMDYRGQTGDKALACVGRNILAFIYPVWLFAFAIPYIQNMVYPLLWLILFTKMSDIWAYVSGVLMGGKFFTRKFSPVVSPKKTWEGIIGSFIITLTVGLLLLPAMDLVTWEMLTPLNIVVYVLFATLLFFLSVMGDLAGSLIKRGLAVKDSGSLLPGIGGIFDLIDSPAFTVSFVTAAATIIGCIQWCCA